MRVESMLAFSEEIVGAGPFYTNDAICGALGIYDQMALQAVVDRLDTGGVVLTVRIQHSADGRHFVNKNLTAELISNMMSAGATNVTSGGDPSISPTLGFVRLAITTSSSSAKMHVKVHVTLRDQSGVNP